MFNFASLSHRNRKLNRLKSCRPRLEWMEPRTLLSAVSWTGSAGDNNWDTPGNWSTDSVPGSGDDVTIDIAANIVHSDDVTDSINSLTTTEPLTISGGTLSIASASTIGGALTINGGTLTGTGDVSVSGLVTLTAGTLSGSSTLDANGGMLINPAASEFNLDGRTVNNAAGQTATWTGEPSGGGTFSEIQASDGSVFNNLGTFVADGSAIYNESGIGAASVFSNAGNFTLNPSSEVGMNVTFNVPGGSVDLQNSSQNSSQNGSQLDVEGGTCTAAAFNIGSNAELETGQGFTIDTATTITGSGGLLNDGLVMAGNYTYTGTTSVNAGDLQVDGSLADSAVNLGDSGEGDLSGTGTVGAISVGAGGVAPGDTGPGILNADGDVQFVAVDNDSGQGSIYFVDLIGPTAGPGYSQLNVTGQVDLGGSDFIPALGFTPTAGEQFTIIKSTVPIVGTFGGLPEGASLTIGNTPFTISYVGGDGNDVVLTAGVAPAPVVAGISPNSGPDAGGTLVTITGTGFTGATAVDFGTTAATNVTVVNNTTITADSPAGSGVVDVTVITPAGTSATSSADQFTYIAAPTVTGLNPTSGPAAGGTLLTITGTGFTGATAVDFGTTAATDFTVVNGTTITADSPAGTGTVDVTVTTTDGTSATTSSDRFTYIAAAATTTAPTVTGVSPNSGPTVGGTTVTIVGTNFTGATAVDFGTTPATDVVVVNGTTITAVSPPGAGVADVTVITPAGASATTAADQFTYVAPSPTVVSLKRFGFHMHPTSLVLTFSSALDPTPAEDVNNYQIVTMGGRGRNGDLVGHVTRVRAAVYDPESLTVTLYPSQRLDFHNDYRLTVDGGTPKGLMGATGVPLDSQGAGTPGRDDVMTLTWRNLVLPPAEARKFLHPKVKPLEAGRSSSPSAHR
jgi:autotransporter-associated beta strand protein